MPDYAFSGVPGCSMDNDVDGSVGMTLMAIGGCRDGHHGATVIFCYNRAE